MGNSTLLQGVPLPIEGPPDCDLREAGRYMTSSGCILVEYEGSDRNIYHVVVGENGRVWLVTRC